MLEQKITKKMTKIYDEFGAVQKNANLVDLEKLLQNEYLVAKIGVDRAENEPSKVSPK